MEQVGTFEGITFYLAKNGRDGQRRVVVHFLDLGPTYEIAREVASKLGGKVYRGKDFGGGFVFQSYSDAHQARCINNTK